MRFRFVVPIGVLGVLVVTAAGCAGSASSQPPGGVPAAGVAARGSGAVASRAAHHSDGARRNLSGCTGKGTGSFIGGNNSNVAKGSDSGILSGESNDACDTDSGIVAGYSNTVNSSGAYIDELIGAGAANAISGGDDTFIGAGLGNTISAGNYAFIGGGSDNTINGTATSGVVVGGEDNSVSNQFGSVGGGELNKVSGEYGTVAGGNSNTASGTESTVAGGGNNIASGYASFAAGSHADADEGGSFVWSDSSSSSTTKATVANQFVARTAGGVKFFSNSAMTTGVSLAAGGGSWASVSDRAVKTNVEAIDDAAILDKVAAMPVSEWSYISERGVRHVGPMAQDFYAAFGVGEDNKHITSIDEDGVALAAIKALHTQLAQKDAALHALQGQMATMKSQMLRHNALMEREITLLATRLAALR